MTRRSWRLIAAVSVRMWWSWQPACRYYRTLRLTVSRPGSRVRF